MKYADRIARIEARLRAPQAHVPSPSLVEYIGAEGNEVPPSTIHQLSNAVPFAVVREWHKACDESTEEFKARVCKEAPPNALLVPVLEQSAGVTDIS